MIKFKPEKHYLGPLCRNLHDYNGTGQSIRYLKTQACAECQKEAMTKYMDGFKEEKNDNTKANKLSKSTSPLCKHEFSY